MNTRMAIALVAASLAFGKTVEAATIASAPNYGGVTVANSGGTVTCRLFNAGTGTAQITSSQIFVTSNDALPLTFNNCTSLSPNQECELDATIPGNLALACRVTYAGSGVVLRGVTEVRDTSGNILNDLLMQ